MSDLIRRDCLKEYRTGHSDTIFEKGWNSAITTIYKTAKSATIEDGVIKPYVSEQACHEDKMNVLDKIRSEIETEKNAGGHTWYIGGLDFALSIIDKYMKESEE